jgi:hypothetical protein
MKFLRPEELTDLKGDSSKLTKATGWTPTYTFETMLDEMIAYWKLELNNPERLVFKIVIDGEAAVIQGLMSLELKSDHVFVHLIESAPCNKGKSKMYVGVPGNLVAFACQISFQNRFEGNVSFISKTKLINHYIQSLGAMHFGGGVMIIETRAALKLINRYFKDQSL